MSVAQITISLDEYNMLCAGAALADALEEGGVDNWEGYAEATKAYFAEVQTYADAMADGIKAAVAAADEVRQPAAVDSAAPPA